MEDLFHFFILGRGRERRRGRWRGIGRVLHLSNNPPPFIIFISSQYLCYFYHFTFLIISPNFLLIGFVVCFCWFEGFPSIMQVNGGFFFKFSMITCMDNKWRDKKNKWYIFLLLHYSISSHYLFYLYHFSFLTIALNFLFGFVFCFCWFKGFSSIFQLYDVFFRV